MKTLLVSAALAVITGLVLKSPLKAGPLVKSTPAKVMKLSPTDQRSAGPRASEAAPAPAKEYQ